MPRDPRLDVLKILAIFLIMFLHLAPLGGGDIIMKINLFADLLAMPLLYLISIYIFVNKMHENQGYFKKRFPFLIMLFLFGRSSFL